MLRKNKFIIHYDVHYLQYSVQWKIIKGKNMYLQLAVDGFRV